MEQESNDPLSTMSDVCGGITGWENVLSSPEGNVLRR